MKTHYSSVHQDMKDDNYVLRWTRARIMAQALTVVVEIEWLEESGWNQITDC